MGPHVGVLGGGVITASTQELTDRVVTVGDGEHVDVHQIPARGQRRGFGVLPRPAQVEHLDAMHPTDPRIQRRGGQRSAPPRHRLGPLLGAAHVDELMAGFEHSAVDHARPDRLQLVRKGREHGFVEQGQPLSHACLLHQRPALVVHAEGDEGLIPVAVAEVLHPPRHRLPQRSDRQPADGRISRCR